MSSETLLPIKVKLTGGQISKLKRGLNVRVPFENLDGPTVLRVLPSQARKYLKAKRLGKGLVGEAKAIKGAGFFDDLWSGVKSAASWVAPYAQKGLEYIAPKLVDAGIKRLTGSGKMKLQNASSGVPVGSFVGNGRKGKGLYAPGDMGRGLFSPGA
jgi:hypothetical protein